MQQPDSASQPNSAGETKANAEQGAGADTGLIDFYASQANVMLAQYENILSLLGQTNDYAAPGTHCEVLLRDLLRLNLPSTFSVDKGYIYGRRQVEGGSKHCPEIDILIHDTSLYRPIFRLEDFVIVQPEAVRGVIQVKRTLTSNQLADAIKNVVGAKRHLRDCKTQDSVQLDNVFSAAVFFEDGVKKPDNGKLSDTYENQIKKHFEEWGDGRTMPNYIGSLKHLWFLFGGVNALRMHYTAFESFHDGKNTALQGLLFSLSKTVLPNGIQPPFRFPESYMGNIRIILWDKNENDKSSRVE